MPAPAFLRKPSRRDTFVLALAGLLLSVLLGTLAALQSAAIGRLDNAVLDQFLQRFASGEHAGRTVAIDIDDASLQAVGQWPWPRYRLAALIERVAAAGPAAIAIDVLLPEADRVSLTSLQQVFKRDFGIDLAFSGVPDGLMDNDGYLGEVMARTGVVGARYFHFDRTLAGATAQPGVRIDGPTGGLRLHQASGVMLNAPAIEARTTLAGFVNTRADDDGVLRRLPLLIEHGGQVHAALSLAAVMRALGVDSATIEVAGDGPHIRVGQHRVPIDAAGYATLRPHGAPSLYASLPALAVLNGDFRASALRGKIVFIGTSAVGLNDHHRTALDPAFPGLKIHSVMAENILGDHFVGQPPWAAVAVFAACLLAGALVSALFVFGNRTHAIVAGCALLGAVFVAASAALYLHGGLFVSPAAPLLVIAALFVVCLVLRFATERRRAQASRRQLENARQVTIESMASVAETRDPETGAHIKRTQHYVRAIALELRRSGHYVDILSDEYIQLLFISAPLHDIGKVGVPDHILLKPGKLTPDEMEQMKRHAEFGRKIILSTAERIDGENFLVIAGQIAATHHEKWDGSGYPLGLAGQDIPLSGRIMAVADVYDALISRRCYKEPFPHALAMTLLKQGRGSSFDPAVLDACLRIEQEVIAIANSYRDEDDGAAAPSAWARDVAPAQAQQEAAAANV